MARNKIIYGNEVLIDLTADTVTADKLYSGYTAHNASGQIITGTMTAGSDNGSVYQDEDGYIVLDDEPGTNVSVTSLSVTENGTYTAPTGVAYSPVTVNVAGSGGGGLVYETGTFTPTSNTYQVSINFSNTHTEAPMMFAIYDNTGTMLPTSGTENTISVVYADFYKLGGNGASTSTSTSNMRYGVATSAYVSATGTSATNITSQLPYNSDNQTASGTSHPRFWATETRITGYCNTSSQFKTNRTYKWIAIWKPTT